MLTRENDSSGTLQGHKKNNKKTKTKTKAIIACLLTENIVIECGHAEYGLIVTICLLCNLNIGEYVHLHIQFLCI